MSNVGNAVVKYQAENGDEVKLSPNIIKNYLVSGNGKVTDKEVMMFLMLCKHQRLNPFLREAYLIKFGTEQATIVVGKDVFTKRAANSDHCAGWEAGVIVQSNGNIEFRDGTFMIPGEMLVGGWAKVYKKEYTVPISATVSMQEYERKKADGTPMASWKSMPATMIRKVALVQALREAFPEDFQGLYSEEEMPVDTTGFDKPVQPTVEVVDKKSKFEQAKEVFDTRSTEKPAEKPVEKQESNGKKISQAQFKRMYAIAKGNKDLIAKITEELGYEKPQDVTVDTYEGICAEIEEYVKNFGAEPQGLNEDEMNGALDEINGEG